MAELQRIHVRDLPVSRVLGEIVPANRPVIVTGALDPWNIGQNWTPDALNERLGNETVQVYNNYFDLKSLTTLRKYFERHFNRPDAEVDRSVPLPYVRWYTKLRDVRFFWADGAMKKLEDQWSLPAFLPPNDYVLPYAPHDRIADPVRDHFPAKGLFISPRFARTSLHLDPWGSCAVLCQVYGTKRWFFWAPDQEPYLRNGASLVDPAKPDREKFPHFDRAQVYAECMLEPGETMYVPHGWFHEVHSETDCISLTWNFVHASTGTFLEDWVKADLSELDQSVLRFFYNCDAGKDVRSHVLSLIRERLSAPQHRPQVAKATA
jgi:hypothetical protein